MSLRPEIFISAAAPEMTAYRKAARQALLELGARPIEQPDFRIEFAPLQKHLRQIMERCEAVIHLAGAQFGQEPGERTLHAPRLSFTHYELQVAQKLELPIYTFFPAPTAPRQPYADEDEEAARLQAELCGLLRRQTQDFEHVFVSPEDLSRQLRALRPRLMVRKSLAQLPSRPLGARFVGRQRLMEELRSHLQPGVVHLLQPTQSLVSQGGTGTSTLAVEMAWRLHEAGELDFVLWLPAGSSADFEAALASLARTDALALVGMEVVSQRARLEAVLAWFAEPKRSGRWLLIVDGVDSEAAWWTVKAHLVNFQLGTVILTGRSHPWPGLLQHAVAALSAEQAAEFFAARLPPEKAAAPERTAALEGLAEALGRVPLGLAMVAGHLAETGQAPAELLAELTAGREYPPHAELAELFAWVEEKLDTTARNLLRLLSCLAPEPAAIPLAIFDGRGDWPQNSAAFTSLERRGLLMRDESTQTLRLHRAVRQMARDRLLVGGGATEGLSAARVALDAALTRANDRRLAPDAHWRELLIPHCRALLGQLNGHPLESLAMPLARGLAEWLQECGRAVEAEILFRRALAIEERRLGAEHVELAPRMRELAGVLRSLGKLSEATELYRRVLTLAERHAEAATTFQADLQNLAGCLRAADRLPEAEGLLRRSLALEEEQHGEAHPRVANALHRLAGVVEAAHRPGEAAALYRRALKMDEDAFGPEHPRLGSRLYHLAQCVAQTARRAEAEPLFRRALEHEEKLPGTAPLELGLVISELASLLDELGEPSEAETLHRRVLKLFEDRLGPKHPETAFAAASLASFCQAQGRPAESLPWYRQAADIFLQESRRFRGRNPHLPGLLHAYAEALRACGRSDEEVAAHLQPYEFQAPRRVGRQLL